jgi:hypothetical protein
MLIAVPLVPAAKICFLHLWVRRVDDGDLVAAGTGGRPAAAPDERAQTRRITANPP